MIEFEKPNIECLEVDNTNNYAKFVCEPLERGYGVTIGNSLRRILLSSLTGCAITSVKIEGVLHEFSSIPNVVEDVPEIIVNLKTVRLKSHDNIIKILKKQGITNLSTFFKPLFIPVKNEKGDTTYPGIDDIINNNELKSDAYKYLGDFIWTYKHIKLKNYTTTEQSILTIAQKKGYLKLHNEDIKIISIDDLLQNWVGYNKDNNYSYNQESICNQLKYYLNIFANSQRFFVSYVTGFRFGKISNKSYLQIEPVLRCDLGAFVLYKEVKIIESIHDWRTALPQSAILKSTRLDIILKYKVTYENISKESTPITTTISLTWDDIIKNSDETKNNQKNIWFTLRNAVCEDKDKDEDNGGYKDYIDDEKKFGKYTYNDGLGYFLNINETSLKTLEWPYNESLLLTDETEFNNIKNNPLYNKNNIKNYANTADITTFNNKDKDEIKKVIQNQSGPFGTLRMHNFLYYFYYIKDYLLYF